MFEVGIVDKQKKYLVVELIYFNVILITNVFWNLRKIYLGTALPVTN